jgi:hypothetical protein
MARGHRHTIPPPNMFGPAPFRYVGRVPKLWPRCQTNCADCGVGCHGIGEWYMVNDEIWEQAWAHHPRKPWHWLDGQQILCIGCLEKRLGRTLTASDFIPDVPCNDPKQKWISERLRDRLIATVSRCLRAFKHRRSIPAHRRTRAAPGRPSDTRRLPRVFHSAISPSNFDGPGS